MFLFKHDKQSLYEGVSFYWRSCFWVICINIRLNIKFCETKMNRRSFTFHSRRHVISLPFVTIISLTFISINYGNLKTNTGFLYHIWSVSFSFSSSNAITLLVFDERYQTITWFTTLRTTLAWSYVCMRTQFSKLVWRTGTKQKDVETGHKSLRTSWVDYLWSVPDKISCP